MLILPLGILLGFLLGLIPGFHVNNLLPLIGLLPFASQDMVILIISLSVSYVFSSFFPSILLGAPTEGTALTVLPGHKLVLKGKAVNALTLSFLGGLFSLFISVFVLAFFSFFVPVLYPYLKIAIPYLLLLALFFLVVTDRVIRALVIVALSSILGILTFNFNILLPLLTGFFGLSTLLISFSEKTKLPKQEEVFSPELSKLEILRSSFLATLLASFFNTVPAISSSITAIIGRIFGRMKAEEFLVFMGGTNTTYMAFSFLAFVLLGNTRSGSAVLLSQFFNGENLLYLLGIILVSGIVASLLCIQVTKRVVKLYEKVSYRKLTLFAIIFLVSAVTFFTGFFGLAILFTSTSIGILANFLRVRRINCMAALIIPTVLVLL